MTSQTVNNNNNNNNNTFRLPSKTVFAGVMANAFTTGSSGLFLLQVLTRETLHSHSASFHPGVQVGSGKFNAGGTLAYFTIFDNVMLFSLGLFGIHDRMYNNRVSIPAVQH